MCDCCCYEDEYENEGVKRKPWYKPKKPWTKYTVDEEHTWGGKTVDRRMDGIAIDPDKKSSGESDDDEYYQDLDDKMDRPAYTTEDSRDDERRGDRDGGPNYDDEKDEAADSGPEDRDERCDEDYGGGGLWGGGGGGDDDYGGGCDDYGGGGGGGDYGGGMDDFGGGGGGDYGGDDD